MKVLELIGIETAQFLQIKFYLEQFLSEHHVPIDLTCNTSSAAMTGLHLSRVPTLKYGTLIIEFQDDLHIESLLKPIVQSIKKDYDINTCMNCSNCKCKNKKSL